MAFGHSTENHDFSFLQSPQKRRQKKNGRKRVKREKNYVKIILIKEHKFEAKSSFN